MPPWVFQRKIRINCIFVNSKSKNICIKSNFICSYGKFAESEERSVRSVVLYNRQAKCLLTLKMAGERIRLCQHPQTTHLEKEDRGIQKRAKVNIHQTRPEKAVLDLLQREILTKQTVKMLIEDVQEAWTSQ